jgi:hypothetical protein
MILDWSAGIRYYLRKPSGVRAFNKYKEGNKAARKR